LRHDAQFSSTADVERDACVRTVQLR
jgi:hypothetical protein